MKKLKLNKLELTLVIILIAIFCGLIVYQITQIIDGISLYKNMEYSYATVIDTSRVGRHNEHYLDYEFNIDGKSYDEITKFYPNKETFRIGDTIVVVYDKTKTNNFTSQRDFNESFLNHSIWLIEGKRENILQNLNLDEQIFYRCFW